LHFAQFSEIQSMKYALVVTVIGYHSLLNLGS